MALQQMFYTISSYCLWTNNIKYLLLELATVALDSSERRPYDLIQTLTFVLSGFHQNPVVLMLHWGAGTLNPTTSTMTAVKMINLLYKLDTEQSYLKNLLSGTSWEKERNLRLSFFFFFYYLHNDLLASGVASISVCYKGFRLKCLPRKLAHICSNKYIWCSAHQCFMRHFASLQIFLNIFSLLIISYQLYSWSTR